MKKFLILLSVAVISMFSFGCNNNLETTGTEEVLESSTSTSESILESSETEAPSESVEKESITDAEKYYREKSELIASYDVKTSDNIQSEKQATDDISNRGFEQYPISYEYSMDGTYLKAQEALDKNEEHPIYQTYYISSAGEIWTIIVTNGSIIANPVSYNLQSERGAQLVIAESEIIIGYDSHTNMFYETIPKESELIVHIVDKINSETLESLTIEVLSKL